MLLIYGCAGNGIGPIEKIIIDNEAYTNYDDILTENQPETIAYDTSIFTNIHYIESPDGTVYDIEWKLNDETIATDTATVVGATQGAIVFELDTEEVELEEGVLTVNISSNGKMIIEKDVELQ